MTDETIRLLVDLNNEFYWNNHESFSNTRKGSWPGWARACNHLERSMRRCRVLDVACGNLRFERYFRDRYPHADLSFDCIDSCPQMFQNLAEATLHEVDVLERLMDDEPLFGDEGKYDLAVSFGFMHHVPTQNLRIRLMNSLVESLKPGGVAAVSFWRFADDVKLAKRAAATTEQGVSAFNIELEENDYLIGWDGKPGVYRYCHSFSLPELDEIIRSVEDLGTCIDRFGSDGRNGALNFYAIIRRC